MDGLECSEVSYKSVKNNSYSSRLDSNFFNKNAIAIDKISKKWEMLSCICPDIKSGTTPTVRDDSLKEGVALLKTTDIRNNVLSSISKDKYFYIDEETNKKMLSSSIQENDVLINIVGATTKVIGRVSIVPKNFIPANITQAMARLRIANNEFIPEYLFAFLLSSYAQRQTNKIARQTGQFNMNLIEVGSFRIWKASFSFQQNIATIVNSIKKMQDDADIIYMEAELLVQQLLDIPCVIENRESTTKNFLSSYKTTGRLDAEYYQPKYDDIYKSINRFEITDIPSEFYVLKNSGTEYSESISDVGVIKTKQLSNIGVNIENVESYFEFATCEKYKSNYLETGDIVFATMGVGSLGKISIFDYSGKEKYITDSTLRIYRKKPHSKVLPEVVCMFLQSNIGQELIYRYVVGSTGIINIYDDDIAKIPIPVFEKNKQKEIADKVQKSFDLRRKSKELLNVIKQAVEIAIEDSEDVAIKWLKNKVDQYEC